MGSAGPETSRLLVAAFVGPTIGSSLRSGMAFIVLPVLVLAATLSLTTGCSLWEVGAEKDVIRNGIAFDTFRVNKDGSKMGMLAEDTLIDDWPCRRGFADFHPDWTLDECHLSRDYERNGIFMPKGTRVFPDRLGNPGICLFPHDLNTQGYICRGNRSGGFMTAFYPNGRLHWFYVREPVEVSGIHCKDSLFEAIYLHPNGRLKQCKLERAVKINGVEYRRGAVIHLDAAGTVFQE